MVLRGGEPMSADEYRSHLHYLTSEGQLVPAELAHELDLSPVDLGKWNMHGCSGAPAAYLRLAVRAKRAGMPWRHNEVPIRFTEAGMELGKPGDMV